jgi:hypothetical protein
MHLRIIVHANEHMGQLIAYAHDWRRAALVEELKTKHQLYFAFVKPAVCAHHTFARTCPRLVITLTTGLHLEPRRLSKPLWQGDRRAGEGSLDSGGRPGGTAASWRHGVGRGNEIRDKFRACQWKPHQTKGSIVVVHSTVSTPKAARINCLRQESAPF